jgi:hypothetical protein
LQPFRHPTSQPVRKPSSQPSCQPFRKPSKQPSCRPRLGMAHRIFLCSIILSFSCIFKFQHSSQVDDPIVAHQRNL